MQGRFNGRPDAFLFPSNSKVAFGGCTEDEHMDFLWLGRRHRSENRVDVRLAARQPVLKRCAVRSRALLSALLVHFTATFGSIRLGLLRVGEATLDGQLVLCVPRGFGLPLAVFLAGAFTFVVFCISIGSVDLSTGQTEPIAIPCPRGRD